MRYYDLSVQFIEINSTRENKIVLNSATQS